MEKIVEHVQQKHILREQTACSAEQVVWSVIPQLALNVNPLIRTSMAMIVLLALLVSIPQGGDVSVVEPTASNAIRPVAPSVQAIICLSAALIV